MLIRLSTAMLLLIFAVSGLIMYERTHTLLPALTAIFSASIAMPITIGAVKELL
jgi:hypothetical protein